VSDVPVLPQHGEGGPFYDAGTLRSSGECCCEPRRLGYVVDGFEESEDMVALGDTFFGSMIGRLVDRWNSFRSMGYDRGLDYSVTASD
jgi:hypothetical protein